MVERMEILISIVWEVMEKETRGNVNAAMS
jgi:hypothetical protein